jgi:hypothetical protein
MKKLSPWLKPHSLKNGGNMKRTALAVALSAYDMLTKPETLRAVQESFKEAKAKEGK